MEQQHESPVFLGMSTRAGYQDAGLSLLGLTHNLPFPFFPQNLSGLQCLVGINKNVLYASSSINFRVIFTDEQNPTHQAWLQCSLSMEGGEFQEPTSVGQQASSDFPPSEHLRAYAVAIGAAANQGDEPGAYEVISLDAPPMAITEPTSVLVEVEWESEIHRLGRFTCNFVEPRPISPSERRAIASRPGAMRAIRLQVACNKCGDSLRFYSLLDPEVQPASRIDQGAIYLLDAPDHWQCRCGSTTASLVYAKRGIHELFRHTVSELSPQTSFTFRPLYEHGQIDKIVADYQALINAVPPPAEEDVQKFMEANPVVWAFLSPQRILHKPPVLTKKKADFGILTPQRILYLVEIEKPQTKLATRAGGLHNEVQKGIDQIRDWSVVVGNHRAALLGELDFTPEEVHDVRYMLVAGLSHQTPGDMLIKLQRNPPVANTTFLCFDDLTSYLRSLDAQLRGL